MKSLLICIVLVTLAAATMPATMPIPTQLSYQGRLTSSTGTPITGTKNLTFRIYDGPGAMIWMSGAVPITCTDGLFSVILGGPGMPAITPDVFEVADATLGITVESDPELSPRTPLTSSPYAYKAVLAPYYLPLGGGTLTGDVTWDFGTRDVRVQNFGPSTALTLTGPTGSAVQLESDGNGSLTLRNSTSALNVIASAGSLGGGLALYDASANPTHTFTALGGDVGTVLPDNAISAAEVMDEPGIASFAGASSVGLVQEVMNDLATVTLTLPAAGYVVLQGQVGEIDLTGTTGPNWAWVQIDESAGGGVTPAYSMAVGSTSFPNTESVIYSVSAQRVYFKAAGTYTFRLEAAKGGAGPSGAATAYFPVLTAMYLPTSYGSVSGIASSDEAGAGHLVSRLGEGSATPATGTQVSGVQHLDLRELELKAAKTEAAAQKAQLELLQAQLNQQSSGQTNR